MMNCLNAAGGPVWFVVFWLCLVVAVVIWAVVCVGVAYRQGLRRGRYWTYMVEDLSTSPPGVWNRERRRKYRDGRWF